MDNTICGIASSSGVGGVGIVRISGKKCLSIAKKILKITPAPRYANFTEFYDGDEVIDKGIAIYFKAPNSFTGEDILELQGHGGIIVMQNILQSAVKCGAKLAVAGEFSQRAFLNGKIDLVQAEALADLITSTSNNASKSALRSLNGEFSNIINSIRKNIIDLRIFVEASIDFVDEEIDFINNYQVADKLEIIQQQLNDILLSSNQGAILRNGISIAIIGKPNAGKSSLLNALTLENTAIVTSVAGTTRDTIKEQILIAGMLVNIIDTAGIRESDDIVEEEGIKRAKIAIQQADIILLVFEKTPDLSLITDITGKIILVQNKIDLQKNKIISDYPQVNISAKNNIGIDELRLTISKVAGFDNNIETTHLARTRHIEALKSSLIHINNCKQQLQNQSFELLADELKQASNYLGKITGKFSSDDLLGEIFSSFCIGK